ncbi:MAG: hypothetical protein GY792_14820 [Gammaproteobacteria bacterium]|nr:hypothetical protein [Gammaproteobacteria bacterium]
MLKPTLAVLLTSTIFISQISAASETDKWQFEVTPYLLAAGMDGTVGVHGHTADIDVSFSDILDDLDSGFMGLFTAKKGPWTLALEGVYMKLEGGSSNTVTGPGGILSRSGKLGITNTMYIAQGSVAYRILDDKTKLDVIGAIRYTDLKVKIDVEKTFTLPPFGGSRSEEGSEGWIDAVVGVRALHPVSDRVLLLGYADIGAGGSDLTYQVMVGANWEFSEGYTAKLGYRHLYWDYEDGGTVWDMTASGPYLGLGIQF